MDLPCERKVKLNYPAIINKDSNSDYGITIPDLPGCFSAGSTMDEALLMGKEAIETHIEGLILDKEPIPQSSKIEDLQKMKGYSKGIWALIEIDLTKISVKIKRINITMPENVIQEADKFAKQNHLTRSGLLTQAVSEYIHKK